MTGRVSRFFAGLCDRIGNRRNRHHPTGQKPPLSLAASSFEILSTANAETPEEALYFRRFSWPQSLGDPKRGFLRLTGVVKVKRCLKEGHGKGRRRRRLLWEQP